MRKSRYEQIILDIIESSCSHPSAEDLFFRLRESEPHVVLATVYNNLNALCSKGLVRRLSVSGYPDRFDRVHRHDHLVCRRCGHLEDHIFRDFQGELKDDVGEQILGYELMVYYLCPDCRKKHLLENRRENSKQQ